MNDKEIKFKYLLSGFFSQFQICILIFVYLLIIYLYFIKFARGKFRANFCIIILIGIN